MQCSKNVARNVEKHNLDDMFQYHFGFGVMQFLHVKQLIRNPENEKTAAQTMTNMRGLS